MVRVWGRNGVPTGAQWSPLKMLSLPPAQGLSNLALELLDERFSRITSHKGPFFVSFRETDTALVV